MSALIKSTASAGSMTLLSRLLGLARDIVIARFFSASDAADAFFVAFKIPNFLRRYSPKVRFRWPSCRS